MKLRLLAVGKLKDRGLQALVDDYESRIRRYCPFDVVEARDVSALSRLLVVDAFVVALEVNGRELSSRQFSQEVARWLHLPVREVVFLIGGAEGLPESLSARADYQLSLSRLTLPHRLARLLLSEQLYRAFSLLRNEPYARED